MAILPKEKGGLGILNLKLQNDALLLKHLDKFYNRREIPCVELIRWKYYQDKVPHAAREVGSFWWKDVLRLSNLFRSITTCKVGDGTPILFWEDSWTGNILSDSFPHLLSFTIDTKASVKEIVSEPDFEDCFHLPLSQEAYEEFEQLESTIADWPISDSEKDTWSYIWGSSTYSSRKLYKLAFQNVDAHPAFKWLWQAGCTPRIKFFGSLVLVDRLNTKKHA